MVLKRGAIYLVIFLFLISFVSSAIVINEFETNPSGSDSGNEWIEIYNAGEGIVNLGNYTVSDRDGDSMNLTGTISGYTTRVFNWTTGNLVNSDENLTLTDNFDVVIDITPTVSEGNNDDAWARISDGFDTGSNSDWVFQTRTINSTNDFTFPIISEHAVLPEVGFYTDDFSLIANNISDNFNVENVWIGMDWSGAWANYTGVTNTSSNYSYTLVAGTLTDGQSFSWRYYANDSTGNVQIGAVQTMTLMAETSFAFNPATPDGLNDWYVSEPLCIITADAAALTTWYRWDAQAENVYTTPFYFNWSQTLGGVETIYYRSNFTGRLEDWKNQTVKVDMTAPVFSSLSPVNQSNLVNTMKPEISAYIDETYQQNSGVNLTSVRMWLNGVEVIATVEDADTIDAEINYTPSSDLGVGENNVSIYAEDYAGWSSSINWSFNVSSASLFGMYVNNPIDRSYSDERKVLLDVLLENGEGKIEYIDWTDRKPRWRRLCQSCTSYNRSKSFRDARFNESLGFANSWHNITIRATDEYNHVNQTNISFFVDSKDPKLSRSYPKRRRTVNGSEFSVRYTEDNLDNIKLKYGNSGIGFREKNLTGCSAGRNQECSTDVSLDDYDGEEIVYWFEISDVVRTVLSKRNTSITIDTTSPNLTINSPENNAYYSRRVEFNISVSETVYRIEYYNQNDSRPKWRRLRSKTDEYGVSRVRKRSFRDEGWHSLLIRAIDDAGNTDIEEVVIEIV